MADNCGWTTCPDHQIDFAQEDGCPVCEMKSRITALQAQNRKLVEALAWYGEQARLARLIHSEGDAGRHALAHDGGKRARAAIAEAEKGEG